MTHFEAASLALQETASAQTFWIGIGQLAVIFLGLAVMRWESCARSHDRVACTHRTNRTPQRVGEPQCPLQ